IPDLERSLKLNDAVLRYLLTLVDARGQVAPGSPSESFGVAAGANGDQAEEADEGGDDEEQDEFEDEDADPEEASGKVSELPSMRSRLSGERLRGCISMPTR